MLLTATLASLAAFSVPAQTARADLAPPRPVATQERGWMGIALETREDVAGDPRVVVARVEPGSPAEQAGLEAGDVLLTVAGSPVAGVEDLAATLGDTRPGQRVTVEHLRRFGVELGSREGSDRGWLGVSIDDGRAIEMLGDRGTAVRFVGVHEGSPAEDAGLRAGDQLVALDGRVARGADDLMQRVGARAPGERLDLAVSREVQVVLGRRDGAAPDPDAPAAPDTVDAEPAEPAKPAEPVEPKSPAAPPSPDGRSSGAHDAAAPRPDARRGYLGVFLEAGDAPVIADVVEGGPAGSAGVRPGDVIVAVDGREVASSRDLQNALADTEPGQDVEVTVRRGDDLHRSTFTLGEPGRVFEARPPRGIAPGARGRLDGDLRQRVESLLEEWRRSQAEFGSRWADLLDEARERGQAHSLPGLGQLGRGLGALGDASWLTPLRVQPDDASREREALREEIRGLREELRELREHLARLSE